MSERYYHPVVKYPADVESEVFDFTKENPHDRIYEVVWGIGRYNEHRPGTYSGPLFKDKRDIHIGIDLFGPVGTPVYAFGDGEIYMAAYNSMPKDYGHVIICKHTLLDGNTIYALYGHLDADSTEGVMPGQKIKAGQTIGRMGKYEENGGWPPHVHFQLCQEAPEKCDMPGAVTKAQLEDALKLYPDPRMVLGPIY